MFQRYFPFAGALVLLIMVLGLAVLFARDVISAANPTTTPTVVVIAVEEYTAVVTPSASATSTDTPSPSPSPTDVPVPTETPELPTYTPHPSNTPTIKPNPTPTNTSTPSPEAIVVAEKLNLRTGPGTGYNIIASLIQGTVLEILGANSANSWIKVATDKEIAGWVAAAPQFVEIRNVADGIPLVTIPPTPTLAITPTPVASPTPKYEYGPKLFEPARWASVGVGSYVDFKWESRSLNLDQYYSIRVIRENSPPEDYCIHKQTQDSSIYLKLIDVNGQNCPAGDYYWSVAIATKLSDGDWQLDSNQNEKNHFGIGAPHSNAPSTSEEGGGVRWPKD